MNLAYKVKNKVLNLNFEDIYKGNLILVNSDHPLNSLVLERNIDLMKINESISLEKNVINNLFELIKKTGTKDKITLVSGFRNYREQKTIYIDSLGKEGFEFTNKYVAFPNHSEHQTGLAVDIGEKIKIIDYIRPSLPYDGIFKDFRIEASLYGFIERYKENKTSVTKIAAEPWHFRYVGFPHSKIMEKKDICLEEYIEFLKDFKYDETPLIFMFEKYSIEISYLQYIGKTMEIKTTVPTNISGNNIDGFIITEWRNA